MPEHGEGYAIKVDSVWEYFWVFDYDSLRVQLDTVVAEISCASTELTLEGTIPQIQYYNANNHPVTYIRQCHVIYKDIHWDDEHDEWVDGFLARVMQHEFDHLDGTLFIDRLATLRKQMIRSKLTALAKGKVKCNYKIK